MPEVTTYANLRAFTVQPDRLLLTKLYAPPIRADRVPRPRLTTRLQRSWQHKLLLLSAPAGSGKTTALSEWVASEDRNRAAIAWISLDAGDNDPVRFITYFIAALQTAQAEAGGMALALLETTPPPELDAILTTLLNELRGTSNDLVVVLDDAHVLTAPEVQHALTFLIDHLPPHIHLVMASRTEPQVGLAKLRARNQVLEVHEADLRFTPEEIGAFFRQIMGVDLTPTDIDVLSANVEGWAAGLQLAALSLHGDRDVSQRIRTFSGNDRYILDFLLTEVLQQQPPDRQAFLLETSILQRFNAPLCSALTGRPDAQHVLEQLEQANLFIVPLDSVRGWYRYHHLFAELLRDQLQCTQPDRINSLHGQASRWYAAQGFIPEAIYHALAAQDFENALALAAPQGQARVVVNEGGDMRALLTELLPSPAEHPQELAPHAQRLLAAFTPTVRAGTARASGEKPEPPRLVLIEPLSQREREILRLIGLGLSNQEIARQMIVAVSTIKWHINHLYAKLDAHSRTQALARARELSLL
jgi:LuxR family maltose regulon positive regulatory protein